MSKAGWYFAVRNWDKYQHYHSDNRNLKWIKLYTALLFDPDFDKLNAAQKWFWVRCLLIAPSIQNRFPIDLKWWRKWDKNILDLDWIQTRFSLLLELIQTDSRNEVVEHIELPTDLASKMLAQSRVDKSRVETPYSPPLEKGDVRAHPSPPKPSRKAAQYDDLFLTVWNAYPRKENKQSAAAAWSRLNGDKSVAVSQLLPWIEQAIRSEQWQDPSKVPHLSTVLNQRRYLDQPPPLPHEPSHVDPFKKFRTASPREPGISDDEPPF